jgi:polyhydroxyalkanoate synthesis regulator protein
MPSQRLIRKYSNRRWYDTAAGRHVTLADPRELISAGEKIQAGRRARQVTIHGHS